MPLYTLKDAANLPLLTITAENDEALENDLIMFAAAIEGDRGISVVENKGTYWKITYARRNTKQRFLIVKRKED